MPSKKLSSCSQRRFFIELRFPEPVRSSTITPSPILRDLDDYTFAMAALTFILYIPSNSMPKDFSTKGFQLIDDFPMPCDEPTNSAGQPTNRSVSQQYNEVADEVHDRNSSAVFKNSYHDLPKDMIDWLCEKLFPSFIDFVEDDDNSKAQHRGDRHDKRQFLISLRNSSDSDR